MTETVNYRGYRLLVSSVGNGWRAMIYPPGSRSALPESPVELEKCPKEESIAEAKRIVDGRFDAPKR